MPVGTRRLSTKKNLLGITNAPAIGELIIGVSGILVDTGFFSASPQEAEVKRLMTMNSR